MNLDLAYIHAPKNRFTGIIWQKGFRPWKKGETNGACDKRNDINKRISYKKEIKEKNRTDVIDTLEEMLSENFK